LYQPPRATARRILDKELFRDACIRGGVEVLGSWFPHDEDELLRLAPTLAYPVLVKPRSHLQGAGDTRGILVRRAEDLLGAYRAVGSRRAGFPAVTNGRDGGAVPLIQQFVNEVHGGVYSVAGFIDASGEAMAMRAAVKTLQRTRPAGIGVCFEAATIDPE